MPRYDYYCAKCDYQFELRQSFDSEPVADCTKCDAKATRKIYAPPVIFKGSGWYVNDYGKGRGNNGISSDTSEESGAKKKSSDGEKASSSSESKSETATASAKND